MMNPVVRYIMGVIAGFLAGLMFLAILVAALKVGEWLFR
jgi:hypothetical protein